MQFDVAAAPAARLPAALKTTDAEKAMQTARDFEAVFLADAFKIMYQGVAIDPLSGDDNSNQSWREILVDEYAKSFAARGGIGLAAPIARELLAIQEAHKA
jgi:flagellar protein FlgJ